MPGPLNCIGGQFGVTVASSTALTLPTGKGIYPSHILINVNSQAIRWLSDGTAPTSSKGIRIAAGGQLSFMDPNFDYRSVILALRIIEEASAATLDVLYFSEWAGI